eukprot:6241-Pleurochrysis_carterae.AAC.4
MRARFALLPEMIDQSRGRSGHGVGLHFGGRAAARARTAAVTVRASRTPPGSARATAKRTISNQDLGCNYLSGMCDEHKYQHVQMRTR